MDTRIKMRSPPCNSSENVPDSLFEQCAKYVVLHLKTLTVIDPSTKNYCLKEGLTLPNEICEKLVEAYQQEGNDIDDKFVHIFENPATARLKRIRLRNSIITDYGLYLLLNHNLLELDIANCFTLTESLLPHLNEKGDSLISLSLGCCVHILPRTVCSHKKNFPSVYEKRGYILRTPNLRRLSIHKLNISEGKLYYQLLLKPLTKLTHLDLSNCCNLDDLSYLTDLPCLTSLILFNVKPKYPESIESITKLKNLRHLDISQLPQKGGIFPNPNQTLASIVENLPNLVSLDISGTNLAGTGVAEHSLSDSSDNLLTDIPGLRSRVGNPFEFLGLFKTHNEACRRHDIPAKFISGDANEEQIFNAVLAYNDRPDVLQKALNNLFHLFRCENCTNVYTAMKLILESMDRHLLDKQIQISGSASLYYIARLKAKRPNFEVKMKHHMICTILNGMIAFRDDDTMLRNGCLTLCQFNIPEDVIFDYDRLVHIILHVLNEVDQDTGLVQRIAIYLLNSCACQVEKNQKVFLGELGAIAHMLVIIKERLEHQVFDDVLEVAWSTMWNVTDETAINCQRFLDGNGMNLFLGCLEKFPNKDELLRNMMGLLGNVAEVKELRPRLMSDRFVSVFTELLDSISDGIEVSYNAAGVLAHMCSDGPWVWKVEEPKREVVLKKMVAAIERWDLSIERNINYRSFHPILGLLEVTHTPECQHWAAWALANLTKVYPKKYCSLVENDGGIKLLEEVIKSETSYDRIKQLAQIVIHNCRQYKTKGYIINEAD